MQEVEGILKWVLTSAVTGLSFIMVYFFNQIQWIKGKLSDQKQSIALNDAHDKNTDNVLLEIKGMISRLESKLDDLLKRP
jgi:hypothetical protein